QVEEMAHGYAFHFEDDQLLLRSLLAYVVAERSCCPFFEQQVTIKPNGTGIIWQISGQGEIKGFLRQTLEQVEFPDR
ncbi:MAG: hypothetical protein AAGA85_28305, partial [Bacteroidota bacterium]